VGSGQWAVSSGAAADASFEDILLRYQLTADHLLLTSHYFLDLASLRLIMEFLFTWDLRLGT